MLVLSRKVGEKLVIDGNITVEVVKVQVSLMRLVVSRGFHGAFMREESPSSAYPGRSLGTRGSADEEARIRDQGIGPRECFWLWSGYFVFGLTISLKA